MKKPRLETEMTMKEWSELQSFFLDCLLGGDSEDAVSLARKTLEEGHKPFEFFEMCIGPSMKIIGQRFEILEIFLPEMVIAADIVQQVNDQVLNPAIEEDKSNQVISAGKVLLATVQGDLHDIGKNMVDMMLQVNGYQVFNLGIDVPADKVIERAEAENVDIIGLSALLTTTLPYMKEVISFIEGKGVRNKYKVIVGGAAPTPEYAQTIGADGYGRNAADAVELCNQIMLQKRIN
jgi:methylmalonyl-CoA mutase cobalamin-binding domain/chain